MQAEMAKLKAELRRSTEERITISTIVSAMQCIYYIALINFRDSGSDLWRFITTLTARFRGVGSLIFSLSSLFGAWNLVTGQVYRMTLQWRN
jgi:hypothetical protein